LSSSGFEAYFDAPLADLERQAERVASYQTPRPVVLVVEDEPLVRMNAVDMVEEAGFEAVEAANSKQALDVLESRSDVGIILSDIDMPPGIDGMALVAIIRQRWPPISIILVSGHVASADVRIPEGGVFFSKPYWQPEIVAALHRIAAER
jgi:CheY-like chemotaxis protein